MLQDRIQKRLGELRRSARDVSLGAGLGPDAIRTILSGRSKSPRGETLAALARQLECDVGYLLGTQHSPYQSSAPITHEDGTITGVRTINLVDRLREKWGGVHDNSFSSDEQRSSDIMSLPDYLPGKQSLAVVEDLHASEIVGAGGYLHTRAIGGSTSEALTLNDRDLIIVQRMKPSGDGAVLQQLTCRRVRLSRDGALLELPSTALRDDLLIGSAELPILDAASDTEAADNFITGSVVRTASGEKEFVFVHSLVLRAISIVSGPKPPRDRAIWAGA